MEIIQVIGLLFSVFMIYLTYLHFRRKNFSIGAFVTWMALWIGFCLLIVFVKQARDFAEKNLQFSRLMDLVMVLGLAVLSIVTFLNFTALSRMEKKLEKYVRALALEDLEKQEEKNKEENKE